MERFKLLSAFLQGQRANGTGVSRRYHRQHPAQPHVAGLGTAQPQYHLQQHRRPLGGWGLGELIALLGVFRLVNTMMIALIWPNTEKFNQSIRDGSMDYTMLQPINSMFLVTFSRITVWRIWDLVLAIVLIVVGINMTGDTTTPLQILTFILLTISGAVVIYSLWIVLISLTFWFTKFDNNVTILHALLDAGRYPVTVYPAWLRIIVTFVIPIAVATTIPSRLCAESLISAAARCSWASG